LWWRGGNGSRFPETASQIGTYFVDGSSKSFLDYVGMSDYNQSIPTYTSNFAGTSTDSLTTRLNKTDTLIKRLFEYSNIGFNLNGGHITVDSSYQITTTANLIISLPHVAGHIIAPAGSWTLSDGQLVYFYWNQSTLAGSDQPIDGSLIVSDGNLPLPEDNQTIKYFMFAHRVGSSIYLWDGTEIPAEGRYPVPIGRQVYPTAVPATLTDNIVWDGSILKWEKLSLLCSTGISSDRNILADNTVGTALTDEQALKIIHTWNSGSTPNYVTISVVSLPLASPLKQNEFLCAVRKSNAVIFIN
jgi:hypothetical protein